MLEPKPKDDEPIESPVRKVEEKPAGQEPEKKK
jgi:hypothetical protein